MEPFQSAFGTAVLQRRPPAAGRPLQAWDAADSYLLAQLREHTAQPRHTLIVNDRFGALALALHAWQPHSWGDSCLAHLALQDNLARNGLAADIVALPATQPPTGHYRAVLWRIPKALALLREQAALLQPLLAADTLVLAGAMLKHLPAQAAEILAGLGAVETLPAQKKARVLRVMPDPQRPPLPLPPPQTLRVPEYDLQLEAGANVFARDKLDIGARFFLEQFAALPPARRIADLGCGNGVLGIVAKRRQPAAHLVFCDESYQAVAAAETNYRAHCGGAAGADFCVDDGLSRYRGAPFDLVLCNPPFHQDHVVGDQIAWQMFTQSLKHLRPGGELWVVGNRHLQYHVKLRRLFGNCRQIAANPKFAVLAARRSD